MSINTPIMVTTTSDDRAILESLAHKLLERNLAACCQIGSPVTSIYRWQEKIETSQEFVCTIKTTSDRFAEVQSLVTKLHNYDEPELVATEISNGSSSYLQWIVDCCESTPE